MSTLAAQFGKQGSSSQTKKKFVSSSLQGKPVHFVLILVILASSFSLIYVKDLGRRLFIDHQNNEALYAKKIQQHQQLLLEKSTWSTHSRIQLLAAEKLGMSIPTYDQTVVINAKEKRYHLMHALNNSNEKPA